MSGNGEIGGPFARRVSLPDGRTVDVRATTPDDLEGLRRLFEELPLEDRYTRFFSAYRPTAAFLEGLAGANGRDEGLHLVAVAAPAGPIVGEAGYTVLPNGDAEFGITVAAGWRGGLGSSLLGALLDAAAAGGVPNLEGQILTGNQRMLALVRHWGYATVDHDGYTSVRVLLGTSGFPTWPGTHDRRRVLVEVTGGRWEYEEAARAAGFQVIACPGPASGPPEYCPLLRGALCPMAAGADAIVFALPLADARSGAILAGHERLHTDVPLCIDAASGSGEWADPCGARRLPRDASDMDVIEALGCAVPDGA